MTESFPHSGWSSSVAYADLKSLDNQGFVRMTEQGEARGEDRYEATSQGAVHFRVWLREGSEAAPALHDPTRARLLLCGKEDLPAMLALLREEQKICTARFHRARWELNRETRFGHLASADGSQERSRLLRALMVDDVQLWGNRALRLKRLRLTLEGHDDDIELDTRDLEDDGDDG